MVFRMMITFDLSSIHVKDYTGQTKTEIKFEQILL